MIIQASQFGWFRVRSSLFKRKLEIFPTLFIVQLVSMCLQVVAEWFLSLPSYFYDQDLLFSRVRIIQETILMIVFAVCEGMSFLVSNFQVFYVWYFHNNSIRIFQMLSSLDCCISTTIYIGCKMILPFDWLCRMCVIFFH